MKKALLILSLLFVATILKAQDFQGVAIYKTHTKLDIKLDSTQMGGDMQEKMLAMLKKQFEKTYKLNFNKEESIYKEEEKLEAPQPQGMVMVMVNTGGSDVLYKNTKENRYTSQNESFSKIFLIQDELKKVDWILGSETKNIGDYTCYKATFKREVEVIESGISVNNDKEFDDEVTTEEREIIAWYTPQIPVSNGPENYHGLPGLILEVNDGNQSIMCSKIIINPESKIKISEPTKGKKVSQEKYDAIMDKKMKEMQEQYDSEHRGREGETIEIRIGG
ncbi:MAG: GLPGLI family protein [Flavobacteriaceae bacterium]|nr:GLPGLI family protein [Flavobacteriaceae bacterium]